MTLLLVILLILLLVGGIGPWAPGGLGYGFGPKGLGLIGVVLIILIVMILTGTI